MDNQRGGPKEISAGPIADDPEAFVEKTISNADAPVVMFALEWCEFCWSVRNMFKAYGVPYVSIDLDSVAYQEGGWGRKIRTALSARTEIKTIPQIFVGGQVIGGCTETFDAIRDGSMQVLLQKSNVEYDKSQDTDPYSFLPTWLHPR